MHVSPATFLGWGLTSRPAAPWREVAGAEPSSASSGHKKQQVILNQEQALPRFHLWQAALSTLNPSPTDSCPLYLNYATVAALPSRVSRHNSPSAAHFVTRLVRTCLPPGTHRCILCLTSATEGVRLAARIVDTPCNEMDTDTFLEEIKKVGKELGIVPTVIRDEELKTRGFG
ncbi:putative aminopeptidase NPEPL1, partial [Eschrichtius robustus]|nr:putative aminopeptidase NPEPL1 [Eschrichtius robustus]